MTTLDRCRYQHFGCEFSTRVSADLRGHEASCQFKPAQPIRRRRRKSSGHEVGEDGDNNTDEDEEEEEEEEEDDDDDEEEDIEIEDIFISNFAFILVLLRAYIMEYVDIEGSASEVSFSFEFLLLLLISAWLYHAWQENGFLMLDETSPFIASWFILVVLVLMVLRSYYSPAQSQSQLEEFRLVMAILKPALTVMTGLFSCCVHGYVHNMVREENMFVLSCVTGLSLALSGLETFWQLQVSLSGREDQLMITLQGQMDQLFYYLFWLQSFFIVLPFGLVGRNFLDF